MPKVNCDLTDCIYCIDGECTNPGEIYLAEDHYCCGGCDDGWVFIEESEEE